MRNSMSNTDKITTLSGSNLEMIDNVKNSIDRIIRKNEPDCDYVIKRIKFTNDGTFAIVTVETPANKMILDYNLRLDLFESLYLLRDICIDEYFIEIGTLEDVFSEAIHFVKYYVNNPDTNDQECKILEFSFDTGEFLVSILDRHKSPVARVFSFEIDFDSDNYIEGLKYYGEVTADMIENNPINR
jgi:hypothetical protein|nr:MAG TPA: hypothetical protein [Caudoviricetes sp.]DAX79926.1 MAG TPA: hypothetical protein [Caudoviricetes sp.]